MSIPVITIQGYTLVKRLRQTVSTYERRYEMSTTDMVSAVRRGDMRETAEVSKWLQAHTVLNKMAPTPTAGTPSRTFSTSTRLA